MKLCVLIHYIFIPWSPLYYNLFLCSSISNPMKSHIRFFIYFVLSYYSQFPLLLSYLFEWVLVHFEGVPFIVIFPSSLLFPFHSGIILLALLPLQMPLHSLILPILLKLPHYGVSVALLIFCCLLRSVLPPYFWIWVLINMKHHYAHVIPFHSLST